MNRLLKQYRYRIEMFLLFWFLGLARAIESKYNVSATAIRYLYRRNRKGITAKLDDDLLKYYCSEDTFLMQVATKGFLYNIVTLQYFQIIKGTGTYNLD